MEFLIGIAFGLAAAWLVPWSELARQSPTLGRARTLFDAARRKAEGLLGREPARDQPAPPADDEPLSTRLHRLENAFTPTTNNSAHPRELAEQPDFIAAARLLEAPSVPLDTVLQYALGANWGLASAALAALGVRPDGVLAVDDVLAHLDRFNPWPMYFALNFLTAVDPRPDVGAPAVCARDWWAENIIVTLLFREYFMQRARLGDEPLFGPRLATVPPASHAVIRAFLQRVHHPFAEVLLGELKDTRSVAFDRTFLTSFGRFWQDRKEPELLIEPDAWIDQLMDAEMASLEGTPPSLLVSGEPRVGKSSYLKLLAKRLEREGWQVFEAGGADLMAGQQWFGQLEGRIQQTVEELAVSKKLVWYIPDILQIALSGTHGGQAASILDQILPAISAGRLVVWTEASPASTARLLRLRPALRSALELIRLEPQSQEETEVLAQTLVRRLGEEAGQQIDAACVDVAMHSARQYMTAASLPGPVLDLIKLTVSRAGKADGERIGPDHVIQTLAQLTGLPVSILDNKERVDLAAVRHYFASRVIGQDEAVTAVVERIAMLKAGLNDPAKPIGVFLFAGPTGTGKTELAKTVAEFLFGSTDRLIRLDMSEFQTPESTVKILGEALGDSDSLVNRVRKQPFCVVLLDEFEKAHANVWDLFLQVFDDARLTDALGHVADFRHCIIILTTNLGATSHRGSGLGFAPASEAFSSEQIMRAVSQTFRPEFQNRLDKVIVFRPLTRDLMRDILKKELNRVLERRGLKDREWAVEWEASAQEFLLEKGFSPEMGARPLKRAIDQYVIAPLAATIVEKRFPQGDQFVFVRSDGRAIQAEFVDPDGEGSKASGPAAQPLPGKPLTLPAMILAPGGTGAEAAALEAEYARLVQELDSEGWEARKLRLAEAMRAADFWSRADRHETLSRMALMDRVKAAAATAQSLRTRLARGAEQAGKSSRELVARLALQLHLINEGIRDVAETAPIEVALLVEPALERPGDVRATREWCAQLLAMYRAWADNRHMQLAEVAGEAGAGLPLLLISGFGAHRRLAEEVGLHVLDLGDDDKGSGRVTARVRLAVAPLGDLPADKLRAALMAALEAGPRPHAVVRRYRSGSSPLVRNMNGGWRTGRLDAVLRGDFDLIAASQG